MTKRETNICKCLAIMLMLAHHLFMYPDRLNSFPLVYGPVFSGAESLSCFGEIAKICVTIFVFLSAYGTAMSYRDDRMADERALMRLSIRRWVKLLVSFQLVYLIAFALCPLGGKSWFTLYSPSRLENLFFALVDFLGLSYIVGTPSYNSAWWYMSYAITLVLLLPWLIKLCRRYGFYVLLPGLLLVRWLNVEFVFFRYFLVVLLGILLAEYRAVEKAKALYAAARLPGKLLAYVLDLGLIAVLWVLWPRAGDNLLDIYEAALCLALCWLTVMVPARIPGLSGAAEFVGRHSMNIFLFHAFIYQNWFYDFTYSLGYPALIYLFLLLSSLAVSIVIEQLKKLLGTARLAALLSDRLCALALPKDSVILDTHQKP